MKKIFGIVTGEYSDYSVCFLVASEKLADTLLEKLNRFDNQYECQEFMLVERPSDVVSWTEFHVGIDAKGNQLEEWTWAYTSIGGATTDAEQVPPDSTDYIPPKERTEPHKELAIMAVSTRSYVAALKAARDLLTKKKAEEAGIA